MNPGRGNRDRGQSSVIGLILILGITLTGGLVILAAGTGMITNAQHTTNVDVAEQGMTQFDSRASLVALGSSETQRIQLSEDSTGHRVLNESAGTIEILVVNATGEETIVNTNLGSVIYEIEDTEVAYQGGGVWRYEQESSVMVSPPEYHYRDQTLTFPVIRVTGDSGSIGGGNQLLVRANGTDQRYPTASNSNPLKSGHVHVVVTSKYHHGWKDYFETRTEGSVRHDPENHTVSVNLTVPQTESFDDAVTATSDDSDAIDPPSAFSGPHETGSDAPSVSPMVDDKIAECQSGGCDSLPANYSGNLVNGTYFANGNLSIGDATYDTSAGTIHVVVDGDLEFHGGGGPPGTNHHEITGGGTVKFYVKGGMEVAGQKGVNLDGDAQNLLVMIHSDGGDIEISGTSQFTGLIYAPNSSFSINGGGAPWIDNVVGAIVVKDATASGNGNLKYESPPDLELEFESMTDITFLHVTENRIQVSES